MTHTQHSNPLSAAVKSLAVSIMHLYFLLALSTSVRNLISHHKHVTKFNCLKQIQNGKTGDKKECASRTIDSAVQTKEKNLKKSNYKSEKQQFGTSKFFPS